jgi:hypothetical protein
MLNRHVKRGARAIELIMPIFIKAKKELVGKFVNGNAPVFAFYKPGLPRDSPSSGLPIEYGTHFI